ncbi:MAG: GFA family protein [Actinomycetota bacterium]
MNELDRERVGRCGCGSITVRAARLQRHVMHCHCENCRRLTSNFIAAVRVSIDDLTWDDPEGHLGEFDLGYATYGFCRNCGSTLYFSAADRPEEPAVSVGLFDDTSGIELHSIWFAHEAQGHNVLDPNVPQHHGNE